MYNDTTTLNIGVEMKESANKKRLYIPKLYGLYCYNCKRFLKNMSMFHRIWCKAIHTVGIMAVKISYDDDEDCNTERKGELAKLVCCSVRKQT